MVGSGINPEGYATGSGTGVEILVPDDRVGLFIRRSAEGKGSTEVEQIRAVWDFAALGAVGSVQVPHTGVSWI